MMLLSMFENDNNNNDNDVGFKNMLIDLNKTINDDGKKNRSLKLNFNYDNNNNIDNPDSDESIASFIDTDGKIFNDNGGDTNGLYSLFERKNSFINHQSMKDLRPEQQVNFETELSTAVHQQNNNNNDPQTKEDSSSIRQNLVLDKNDDNSNDIEQPDPVLMMMKQIKRNNNSHHHHHSSLIDHGTITFSANDNDDYLNKRDLWKFNDEFSLKFPQSQFNNNNNYHNGLSKYRTTTTTNDDSSYELNNKINAFDSLRTSSLKNQQKSPPPATNQFNQDSLLHIFRRGKSSSSSS
ncbi:hypothetical protein DERP_011679 [Dermatophagoides pteronyssinus]|uniref:Uncharacterized protein n=1 Tax=Dermatophagoides pteronyssinus TaxID=6956 RepID=A0ABQ8J370_DERPT|nr:hypothetical protein DERP_011679 [Dermatophagoides pteronyssinus]